MQKLLGFLLFCVAGIWHWILDGIKGMAFERGVDMATPLIGQITNEQIAFWLPTIILPLIGGLLLWKTRPINHQTDSNTPQAVAVGNITINQAPPPELHIVTQGHSQNDDGTIFVNYMAEIVSPYPTGSLFIDAQADGIISLDAHPMRSGMHIEGLTGVRDNHAFTTIMHPFGSYIIRIHLKHQTKIIIEYKFNV